MKYVFFWDLQHEHGANHLTARSSVFPAWRGRPGENALLSPSGLGPEQLYLAEFGLASYLSHRIATFLSLPLSACLLYRAAGRIPHLTWRWLPAGAALYIPPYRAEKMVNILHRFLFSSKPDCLCWRHFSQGYLLLQYWKSLLLLPKMLDIHQSMYWNDSTLFISPKSRCCYFLEAPFTAACNLTRVFRYRNLCKHMSVIVGLMGDGENTHGWKKSSFTWIKWQLPWKNTLTYSQKNCMAV